MKSDTGFYRNPDKKRVSNDCPNNIVGRQNLLAVKLSYCSRIENTGKQNDAAAD